MLELWTLVTTLPLIKLFPYMKFHHNSISRSGVIFKTRTCKKGNNFNKIDIKVMDIMHDTPAYQGLSIYEVLFQ